MRRHRLHASAPGVRHPVDVPTPKGRHRRHAGIALVAALVGVTACSQDQDGTDDAGDGADSTTQDADPSATPRAETATTEPAEPATTVASSTTIAPRIDPAAPTMSWRSDRGWVELPAAPRATPQRTWTAGGDGIGAFVQGQSIVTVAPGPTGIGTTVGSIDPATGEPQWSTDVTLEDPLPPRVPIGESAIALENATASVVLDNADGRLLFDGTANGIAPTLAATATHLVVSERRLIDRATGTDALAREGLGVSGGQVIFEGASTFGVIDAATAAPAWEAPQTGAGATSIIDELALRSAVGPPAPP